MKKIGTQKNFIKLIILLLIISVIWFVVVLEMLYSTFSQDNHTSLFNVNYSTQIKFVYIIGSFLITAYAFLILNKNNTSDHNFN